MIDLKTPKAFFIGLLLVFSYQALNAQTDEKTIEALIMNADIVTAKRKINEIVRKQPGSAKAMYFQALIENDSEKAIKLYSDLILVHKKSKYAPLALNRVGQYYFVKGYYFSARKNFLDLIKRYPDSHIVDEARYYAAKCFAAYGKADSAKYALEKLLSTKKLARPLATLISDDLAALNYSNITNIPKERPKTTKTKSPPQPQTLPVPMPETTAESLQDTRGDYTIQIGAYSRYENAASQKKYFSLLKYPVEIFRAKVKKRYFYKVYIGSFSSKAEAEKFGRAFRKKHGIQYRIVKRDET